MGAKRYRRLFRLRFTRAEASEVDEEFRFHLTMRTRELEAVGYTPERAREIALSQFGDIDDARRFCRAEDEERMREYRRTLWLDNVRQDVLIAIRTMRRQPSFALSTVLTRPGALSPSAAATRPAVSDASLKSISGSVRLSSMVVRTKGCNSKSGNQARPPTMRLMALDRPSTALMAREYRMRVGPMTPTAPVPQPSE